nr:RimK family protein [Nitratireductor sp.]
MNAVPVRKDNPNFRETIDPATPLLVVGRQQDKKPLEPVARSLGLRLVSAREYLSNPETFNGASKVINLCAVEDYLSQGYYVSLLAEARGQKAIPKIDTVTGLAWKKIYKNYLSELTRLIDTKALDEFAAGKNSCASEIFFGEPDRPWAKKLGARAFKLFPAPILEVNVKRRKGGWKVDYIWPISSAAVNPAEMPRFADCLADYLNTRRNPSSRRRRPMFELAILFDPAEKMPPSSEGSIRHFVRAAERQNIRAEIISKKDLSRLSSFDALFIRETTNIDNHTFTFARHAEARGMPVIDDSVSILRCSNKVYLHEALARAKIATPRTQLVTKTTLRDVIAQLSFPCVLKIPDGSFSRGVVKARDADEYVEQATKMLEDSFIVLAQEYLYTDYDWRIGVLDGKPLFACKYHMARGHWQIYNHRAGGRTHSGGFDTMAVETAPPAVIRAAVKASQQMGRGLY